MNITTSSLTTQPSAYAGRSTQPARAAEGGAQSIRYLNSATTVTLTEASHDSEAWLQEYDRISKTRSGPSLAADNSIKTIEERLAVFGKNLSLARPDLAKVDWDVTVKDGRLKVTGNVSAEDKLYMEARLNKDQSLVGAVGAYMDAAKSYLETTDLNKAFTGQNGYTGATMTYNFKDVSAQLEGKLGFRELIAASWSAYDNPSGGERTDPGNFRGGTSLEVLASRLTSLPLE